MVFPIITPCTGFNGTDAMEGPRGKRGKKGDSGEQGVPGYQGEQGVKGDKGDSGKGGGDTSTITSTCPCESVVNTQSCITCMGDLVLAERKEFQFIEWHLFDVPLLWVLLGVLYALRTNISNYFI